MPYRKLSGLRFLFALLVAALGLSAAIFFVMAEKGTPSKESKTSPPSYQALYSVSFIPKQSDSPFSSIEGIWQEKIIEQCEGTLFNSNIHLLLYRGDEQPLIMEVFYEGLESTDRKKYTFALRHFLNSQLVDVLGGEVNLENPESGEAQVFSPQGKTTYQIPPDTLFPHSHSLKALSSLRKGEQNFSHTIFEGANKDQPFFEISTLVMDTSKGKQNKELKFDMLKGLQSWKVSMAYFGLLNGDKVSPFQELDGRIFANGIFDHFNIHYEKYGLKMDLMMLDPLEAEKCP